MKLHSFFSHVGFKFAVASACILTQGVGTAATFNIAPSVVSDTYLGTITLQVGGLTNGESVVVENYYDSNGSGVIDETDMLFQSFLLTDGQWATIGGVRNINVPGDLTGPEGAITSLVGMLAPSPQFLIGTHLIRLSSPGGNFMPVTNTFVVTNASFPQMVSGNVTCSSTNVPNAMIVALTPGMGSSGGDFIAGTASDANGHYSLRLAPGAYQLLAIHPGYVFDVGATPVVVIGANESATDNLVMAPATQVLSGRVVDKANASQGLPGLFMPFQSRSGMLAVTTTDSNGFFNVGVTQDVWEGGPDNTGVAPLGYVQPRDKPQFDTTGGTISTGRIALSKGTAMIYGTIKNETNAPLPGVLFFGDSLNNSFESAGWSAPDGSYCVVALPGTWNINTYNEGSLSNYVTAGNTSAMLATDMAVRADFYAAHTTASITGNVKDATGKPVVGLMAYGNTGGPGNLSYQSQSLTDTNGNFAFSVISGPWHVGLNCEGEEGLRNMGYACVSEQIISVPSSSLFIPFTVAPYGTPALRGPMMLGQGQVGFWLEGASGFNYQVQISTNLSRTDGWNTLLLTNMSTDRIFIQDNQATNSLRFYRAMRF